MKLKWGLKKCEKGTQRGGNRLIEQILVKIKKKVFLTISIRYYLKE